MVAHNIYGWAKNDGVIELPKHPFLVWIKDDILCKNGIELVEYSELDGKLHSIDTFGHEWSINQVDYYRDNILGPHGEELHGRQSIRQDDPNDNPESLIKGMEQIYHYIKGHNKRYV